MNVTPPGTLVTPSGGDTLVYPIYTTATGMVNGAATSATTSFSVTNTSSGPWVALPNAHGGQTIAAKIRFREQDHSMDVLDFVVPLVADRQVRFHGGGRQSPPADELE